MRLSFATAMPVGMESEEETLFVYLERTLAPKNMVDALNRVFPKGLQAIGCKPFLKFAKRDEDTSRYTIRLSRAPFDREKIHAFLALTEFMVEDLSKKKKKRQTDLRKSVEKISFIDLQTIEMALKKYNERTIRPLEILKNCFELDEEVILTARIKKLR
jgi:radical SAM-linked protein